MKAIGSEKYRCAYQAFFLNLIGAAIAFGIFVIANGGIFAVAGDFNVQQIPFAMYANDAIKSGNVVWDWSLDLGSNFIGGMMFYVLGNPSFWISLLFPSQWFIYIVAWLYVLKYAFAGLTAYLWISRFLKNPRNAVAASMLYAFSGFMHEDLLFYHFHDVAALFPLLLITLDMLMEEKKHGPFIFAVTLNVLVNYFFFPGEFIFLAAYFLLRFVWNDGRKTWKMFPTVLLEGILGGLIGCVLLLPAALFTLQNPRVKFDYVGSNSLVFGAERYLFILKALIFPGEVMSDQSAVISKNFSSCAAYLPMTGLVLVIAFLILEKGRRRWVKRMLLFCLVCAVVPIFNAAYSMFAGLYHRWYYMPILLFALASGIVLDRIDTEKEVFESPTDSETAVRRGMVIWSLVTAGFIAFLAFVPWSSSGESKIYRTDLFIAWSCVAVSGTIFTWLILTQFRKYRRYAFTAGVFLYGVGTLIATIRLYNVANGEDAVHLLDRIETSEDFIDPAPSYRYNNRDNPETLTHGYSANANFCSTVSGSIFRFYTSLGLTRDVKSPDPPTGLEYLISAKYTYSKGSTLDDAGTLVQTVEGEYYTYYIYENEDIAPIGFTYDTYMTESEFENTGESDRAILMLKTLVIPDEKEAEVSGVLRHYSAAEDGAATEEELAEISRDHLAEASYDAVRTTSSYEVSITADAEKYVFFSIPNDTGWRAEVNGEEAEIIDINGFMAVKIPAGESRVGLYYTVPGLSAGAVLTLIGLIASIIYIVVCAKLSGRRDQTERTCRRQQIV